MDEDLIGIILKYNKIVKNLTQSHRQIVLKDKTMLQYLAYCLSSKDADVEVIEPALETLLLLTNDNSTSISQVVETYGVVKAVQLTASREDLPDHIQSQAAQLLERLEAPAFSTRSKTRSQIEAEMTEKIKSSKIINLHIHGLNKERRGQLESVLVKLKGVVSLVLDLNHQRCTVRVVESVSATDLASAIYTETNMEAQLVCKNSYGQEILKPLLVRQCEESEENLPPYLDDVDSPVKDKAVVKWFGIKEKTSYLFNCASEFLKDSFYW